jgi:hypothetical protein
MVRPRVKKALYEVISTTKAKPQSTKTPEQLPQEKSRKCVQIPVKADTSASAGASQWLKRPKLIQYNAGRFEISIPYQIAIVLLLGLVLLVLVFFRLGQFYQRASNSPTRMSTSNRSNPTERAGADIMKPSESSEKTLPGSEKIESASSKGDHVIVLVQYLRRADLEPVKQYFAKFDIETEIIQQGGWYYLVTKNMYEDTETPGSDGYKAKQKIIEAGAKYKAPRGYETFAPNFFRDAYGRKIK